jgi:signal transduction histidine kinase
VETKASAIYRDGTPYAIQGIGRDITERKKMLDGLTITDRLAALGNMAGGFAHELNNPLTGVIGYTQLLLDRKDLPEDVRSDLTGIYEEAQRASEVIKTFMVFALKRPLQKQLCDINSLINDVLKLQQYEQRKSNIKIKTHFDPELPLVMAGPTRMRQVFLNIIINAEYSMFEAHEKGTLTISTEKAGEVVRVSFTDDGPGIPPENLRQIFNPFFTTKEIGQGMGMGLSICHSIVTEHGGNIYVENEPGKGATFIVELPISKE